MIEQKEREREREKHTQIKKKKEKKMKKLTEMIVIIVEFLVGANIVACKRI